MRPADLLLFFVIFASMAAAVLYPGMGTLFQPFILHFMMLLLFLSFIKIDFRALLDATPPALLRLAFLVAVKLVVLPTLLYWAALAIVPDYAIPVLLLSGISTGVVAPFIATLVDADVVRVLRMVIVTSVLVPFSLPLLVKILAGAEITIPLEAMIQLLAMVIFVPMIAVLVARRLIPRVLNAITAYQFPITLTLFAIINLGVFSKYSSYFFVHPGQLLVSLVIVYVLSAMFYATGFAITPNRGLPNRLAAGVSLALMNNVLVIVFSSAFFGPLAPLLAAMYMFPFYTMIVPVRLLARRIKDTADARLECA
ncbi:MAG: bile acid:sodium symporter [Desulfomonile sp.]|nr:bile acid:sodium symporter [Desulfomonile sp.]